MKLKYKEQEYDFPSSLAEITLGQRIEFYNLHGKLLDERSKQIHELKDTFDQEIELTEWYLELAARTLSFYTGIDYDTVKAEVLLIDLLNIYNGEIHQMQEQERNIVLLPCYEWNGEKWFIAAPQVVPGGDMTFNEFLHSKETVRQMQAVGQSKWDALPFLCAIYLRKENEEFQESFVYPDSERLKAMYDLPLDIALGVGFFLSNTLNTYTIISLSSGKEKQKESTQPAISTDGDG